MKTIEYFKLQAKNLHKDFKTQKPYFNPTYGHDLYEYAPRFFDVGPMVADFHIDEKKFTLTNAQHVIAKLAGFRKWTDILKASPSALELAKLLFENMHKIEYWEWGIYISDEERKHDVLFDDDIKLDIFKAVFADVDDHLTYIFDYRLPKNENPSHENQIIKLDKKEMKNKAAIQISALPLVSADRMEFIRTANSSFERVFDRIEPENPELVREMWDAEKYIDEDILTPDRLPIDRSYALSMIDAFMSGYVIQLAVEADNQTGNLD